MSSVPRIGDWLAIHVQCSVNAFQSHLAEHGIQHYDRPIALWLFWAICGVAEFCISFSICTSAERLWPLTHWEKRNPIAADVGYAFFVRIVLFPLIAFFEYDWLHGHLAGFVKIRQLAPLLHPALFQFFTSWPVIAFALNFMALDLADYWRHRLSHRYGWWYGIHSLHHAEDQMTFWSDERSHVLEDAITYVWLITVGLTIGVPSFQFPFLILTLRFLGSLSHTNTRISYEWLGRLIFVSPRFHRTHHALRAAGRRNSNFGTALSLWDVIFGTVRFNDDTVETGDAGAEPALAHGSWAEQQRAGFHRMISLARRGRKSTDMRAAS
jgi:sterol desaturase/sphingolipid hydroxylase (fatty acid hydroxylase superfamily)